MSGVTPNPVRCGRKHCTRCGRWRLVVDYPLLRWAGRRQPGPRCRVCVRRVKREGEARRRRDPHWLELHREYDRIWKEGRRRAAGVPARPLSRPVPPSPKGSCELAAEPLRVSLLAWLTTQRADGDPNEEGAYALLELRSGVSPRTIGRIVTGAQGRVGVDTADALAIGIGRHLELIYG